MEAAPNPAELLRSRSYLVLLVFGAIVGIVVAFVAYFFLKGVGEAQHYIFGTLPGELGFDSPPVWWPLPWLALSGLLVALTIRHLPGTAGHKPAEGFKTGGPVSPIDLPGIVIASLATLCLGAVLGPEAPLIAIGSGLGVLAVRLVKRDVSAQAFAVIGAAGSFAAISTLLGLLLAGFPPMEAAGIGGALAGGRARPGPTRRRRGLAYLHRIGQLDRLRDVLAGHPEYPVLRQPRRSRVPLGRRHRHRGRRCRSRDPVARPVPAADRRVTHGPADTRRRPGGRRACDRIRGGNREKHVGGALLRPGPASAADRERRGLVGGGAAARRLQGDRLRPLAEQLPWRAGLPRPSSEPPAASRSRTRRGFR